MGNQHDTASLSVELQRLRDVIPDAKKHGSETTTISIKLLALLLERHDAADQVVDSTSPTALRISQDDVEHLLHARTELLRVSQSPRRVRHPLAKQLWRILAPAIEDMAGKKPTGDETSIAATPLRD